MISRRTLFGSIAGLLSFWAVFPVCAEVPTAPIPVQAQIATRILPFERGFEGRARAAVLIVIAYREGDADSASAAKQMEKALADIGSVAKKPLRSRLVRFSNVGALAGECKESAALAVYLAPGLGDDIAAIARAFGGSGILTIAAIESYVPRGAVLGVEVYSGKPRMSINLGQARAQGLDFPSAVLKLARVY